MTFSTYFSPGVALQGGGGSSGGGGGTPGGSSGQIQYNSGGAFAGMAGTSWDNTARALTITGYSLTGSASASFMDLAGTWNTSGTPTAIKLNITDTASNAASLLMDLGTGGGSFVSRFRVGKSGVLTSASGGNSTPQIILASNSGQGSALGNVNGGSNLIFFGNDNGIVGNWQQFVGIVSTGVNVSSIGGINWTNSSSNVATTTDLFLSRRGAANLRLGAADAAASATVTITIATPGVVTWNSHGLSTGTPVIFSTTGALPTGITAGTTYYAIVVDTNTIRIATSLANALAGTAVNTSGSQSGTQTGSRGAIAQTSSVQSVVAGTTNFPGADKIITGSQGTGTGAGGSLIFQVAPAGSSGSAQNAFATALTIDSASALLTSTGGIRPTASGADTGFLFGGSSTASFAVISNNGINIRSTGFLSWSSVVGPNTNAQGDVALFRDAANTLALRNGTAAQTFNVYNTFTDASNYERAFIRYSSSVLQIGHEAAGTGVTNRLISFRNNGSQQAFIDGAGGFYAVTYVGISSKFVLLSPSDGVAALSNWNLTDFNRLQFGGTTSSFPALKRSATTLQARLADDSAFAGFASANMQAATAYTVATLPGTPGTGMIARVTDATAPTIGTTVVGGGAAYALVNYNGANWTVIGV